MSVNYRLNTKMRYGTYVLSWILQHYCVLFNMLNKHIAMLRTRRENFYADRFQQTNTKCSLPSAGEGEVR